MGLYIIYYYNSKYVCQIGGLYMKLKYYNEYIFKQEIVLRILMYKCDQLKSIKNENIIKVNENRY